MGCPHKPAGKTTLRPYVGGQLFPLEELAAFCCEHAIFENGYARERQDNVKFSGSGPADFPKISASDARGRLHSQNFRAYCQDVGLTAANFQVSVVSCLLMCCPFSTDVLF